MKIPSALARVATHRAAMIAVLIFATCIGALGLLLLTQDRAELKRESLLRDERAAIETKLAAVQDRTDLLRGQLPSQQERVEQSEKIIRQLEEVQSTWDMFIGNRAQQRANAERMQQMRTTHADAVAQVSDLQQKLARANWERESLEAERTRIDSQLRVESARRSGTAYPLKRFWLSVRAWLCIGVALALYGFVALPMGVKEFRRKRGAITSGHPIEPQ